MLQEKFNEAWQLQQTNGHQYQQLLTEQLSENKFQLNQRLNELKEQWQQELKLHRHDSDRYQLETLKTLQETVQQHMQDVRQQMLATLMQNNTMMWARLDKLTEETGNHLKEISGWQLFRVANHYCLLSTD